MSRENGFSVLKTLLFGSGAGGGAVIAIALAKVIAAKPDLVIQALASWGPVATLFAMGMFFANGIARDGISALRENAASSAELASAVNRIADKDDRQAEEQKRLLSYIGTQNEKILERLAALDSSRARGGHA